MRGVTIKKLPRSPTQGREYPSQEAGAQQWGIRAPLKRKYGCQSQRDIALEIWQPLLSQSSSTKPYGTEGVGLLYPFHRQGTESSRRTRKHGKACLLNWPLFLTPQASLLTGRWGRPSYTEPAPAAAREGGPGQLQAHQGLQEQTAACRCCRPTRLVGSLGPAAGESRREKGGCSWWHVLQVPEPPPPKEVCC